MNPNDLMKNIILLVTDADKDPNEAGQLSPLSRPPEDVDPDREKQVIDLLPDHDCNSWANEPEEKYATIDSVTVDAGGGVNGPKHPHDIRLKDPSAYPHEQSRGEQPEHVSIFDTLMQMLGGR